MNHSQSYADCLPRSWPTALRMAPSPASSNPALHAQLILNMITDPRVTTPTPAAQLAAFIQRGLSPITAVRADLADLA
jgi:hypothetical protein